MKLYEILTGELGYAEVRAYAWAKSEEAAKELFILRNPTSKIKSVRQLMAAGEDPFCTQVDDCGWEM